MLDQLSSTSEYLICWEHFDLTTARIPEPLDPDFFNAATVATGSLTPRPLEASDGSLSGSSDLGFMCLTEVELEVARDFESIQDAFRANRESRFCCFPSSWTNDAISS